MRRRIFSGTLELAVYIALVVALVAGLGVYTVGRSDWVRNFLQKAAAQEIANFLGRPVTLGPVEGDLWSGLTIKGLSVTGKESLPELAVEELHISWDLAAMLRRTAEPGRAISAIRLTRPYLLLYRDEKGITNLQRLFYLIQMRMGLPRTAKPLGPLGFTVVVVDGTVDYDLRGPGMPRRPERGRVSRLNLFLDPRRPELWQVRGSFGTDGQYLNSATFQGGFCLTTGQVGAQVAVQGARLARLGPLFLRDSGANFTSGLAELSANLWLPRSGAQLQWTLNAALRGLTGRYSGLPGTVSLPQATAVISPLGAYVHAPQVRWKQTSFALEATLWDFKAPSLVAQATNLNLHVPEVMALLPAEQRQKLKAMPEVQWLRGTADLTGPLAHLDCRLSMNSDSPVQAKIEETTVRAASVAVQGVLHDLARPSLTASVQMAQVQVEDLPRVKLPSGEESQPRLAPLPQLNVVVAWAGDRLSARTALDKATVTGLPMAMRDLNAQIDLAGDVISVRGLESRVGDGSLVGEVVFAATKDTPKAEAVVSVSNVDVASLHPLLPPDFDHSVSGTLQGVATASLRDEKVSLQAQVSVAEPEFDNYGASTASGELVWCEDELEVPWAMAEAPDGRVVLAGRFNSEGLKARFSASDLDLQALGQRFSQEDLVGRGWATGTVAGTYEDPVADVELAAWDVAYQDYAVEALYAEGQGGPKSVQVNRLMAYRDGAVATFAGRVSDLNSREPYGKISGPFRVAGLTVPQVLDWAKYKSDVRPTGQATLSGTVSGTFTEPVVEGIIHLVGVEYDVYRLEELRGPLRLAGDHLSVGPTHGRFQDVRVTISAQIDGLLSDPSQMLTVMRLDTDPIELSRMVVLHRYGVGVGGEASMERAEVKLRGSQLLTAQADIACSTLQLGEERLKPFHLQIHTEETLVKLRPTELDLARGRATIFGEYDTESRRLMAQAELSDCHLPPLLNLAKEAASVVAASRREKNPEVAGRQYASLALRTDGGLSGTVAAEGPVDSPNLRVNLQGEKLHLDGRPLPQVDVACHYITSEKRLEDINLEAQYGQGLVIVTGEAILGDQVNLIADASDLDLHALSAWSPRAVSAAGLLGLTAIITGPIESPFIKGSFDMTNVTVEGLQFDLVSAPIVRVAEGGIDVDSLIVKRGPHEMTGHGHLPFTWAGSKIPRDEPIAFAASFGNADLETLRIFAQEYYASHNPDSPRNPWEGIQTAGQLDASVQLGGTLMQPTLAGTLEINEGAVKMADWAKPIERIEMQVDMAPAPTGGSVIQLADLKAQYDQANLTGQGSVLLKYATLDRLTENTWDLDFGVEGPKVTFVGGTTAENVALDVSLKTTEAGKARLSFAKGQAKLGSGRAILEGGAVLNSLDWRVLDRNDFDITLVLDRARLQYGDVLNGLLNGRVTVKNPEAGQSAIVKGELSLAHALVGYTPSGAVAPAQLRAASAEVPAFRFDIRCGVGEDVRVRGAGINMPLQPDVNALQVTGTPQEPRVAGRALAQQGRASVPGGFLSVKSFFVDFNLSPEVGVAPPPKPLQLRAKVLGEAERLVSEVEIDGWVVGPVHLYLNFAGELPGEIKVSATSEPPLAEDQIYAILGAGPFGGLMAGGQAGDEAVSERFVSLLAAGLRVGVFEPLEAQLRELLGLAEFSINFTLDQPVEVCLGKYLVRNLLVSYRQGLGASKENQWWLSVSYEVVPGTVVSYYTRDDGEKRFSVGYRRVF